MKGIRTAIFGVCLLGALVSGCHITATMHVDEGGAAGGQGGSGGDDFKSRCQSLCGEKMAKGCADVATAGSVALCVLECQGAFMQAAAAGTCAQAAEAYQDCLYSPAFLDELCAPTGSGNLDACTDKQDAFVACQAGQFGAAGGKGGQAASTEGAGGAGGAGIVGKGPGSGGAGSPGSGGGNGGAAVGVGGSTGTVGVGGNRNAGNGGSGAAAGGNGGSGSAGTGAATIVFNGTTTVIPDSVYWDYYQPGVPRFRALKDGVAVITLWLNGVATGTQSLGYQSLYWIVQSPTIYTVNDTGGALMLINNANVLSGSLTATGSVYSGNPGPVSTISVTFANVALMM